ncbi:MAG: PIN domain-containing protein [Acidobacteria bacterium]|nr:PIN domain-containing protein [Acidobacteriota bacterium]
MSRIFWDTNLFIYLIEDFGELSERVAALRRRMLARKDRLYTSTLTLGEVLVKPKEEGNESLRRRYLQALQAGASLVSFGENAAQIYCSIRRDRSIRPPDAIQLACAAQEQIDLFITNDDRLTLKTIAGIQFITSLLETIPHTRCSAFHSASSQVQTHDPPTHLSDSTVTC